MSETPYEIAEGMILLSPDPGRIIVQHDDVLVVEFSLKSKYPDTPTVWSDDRYIGVDLWASDETLYRGPSDEPTTIKFPFPGFPEWGMIAEAVRYTAYIAVYKRGEQTT